MRRVTIPLACALLLTGEARSQSSWKKVNVPSLNISASSVLNSVATTGNLVLASVSGDPLYKALRSTDVGQNWETPPLTALAPLKLKTLNFSFLYGVRGDSVMTSSNQGISWSIANAAVNLNMTLGDVHYINSSPGQAWAVGDTSYAAATGDNWGSFVPRSFSIDSVSMSAVQFFDNNRGFAAGRSTKSGSQATVILRTTDGGANWAPRGLPDTCSSTPVIVFDFVTPRIGWAVQTCGINATIYKSTDSAATWTVDTTLSLFQAFAIDAVDSQHVWIVGRLGVNGRIAKTSNGGANWGFETIPTSGRLLSIAMKDTTTGFACGEAATLLVYSQVGNVRADL